MTDKIQAEGLEDDVLTAIGSIDTHLTNTSNPHSVTKAQVGLTDADDTSDANKPISIATQSALNTIKVFALAGMVL